jgi:Ca-activated chloride channel family protein
MANSLKGVQAAAMRFVELLQANDVAKVIQFNERVSVLADYTGNKSQLQSALGRLRTGGATALLNALDYALSDLRRSIVPTGDQARKGSVLVLSDGTDTASALDETDVVRKASDSAAVVYALRLQAESGEDLERVRDDPSVQLLQSIATETGGRLFISRLEGLERLYTQIADELRNQYVLAYVSDNDARDGTFRAIEVRLKNRRDSRVRFRTGYYAPRS